MSIATVPLLIPVLPEKSLLWFQILAQTINSLSVCAQLLSCVWLFVIPWTIAHQAPLPMGFPRQEYWSGLSFPPPEALSTPEIKPMSSASPALPGGYFTTEPPGKPNNHSMVHQTRRGVSNNLFEQTGGASTITRNSGIQWRLGKPGMLQSTGSQIRTQLSDWTTSDIPILGERKEGRKFMLGGTRKSTHHLHNERAKKV